MIPKIIHYCWFGGKPLPPKAKKYIESWKKFCPDYEIKEWNESNFDVHCCRYVEEAYNAKKWAFVSDYARFLALYNEGGIYFDTDIEVLKPFDNLLGCGAFFGFGWETLTLPVFGASKGLDCYRKILYYYEQRAFIQADGSYDLSPIENSAMKILIEDYGLVVNGKEQMLKEDIVVYPKEYFCSTKWDTGEIIRNPLLYIIHYADGSWLSDEQKQAVKIKKCLKKLLGSKLGDLLGTAVVFAQIQGVKSTYYHGKNYVIRKVGNRLMKLISALYVNRKKIVFENFLGRGFGDNPKYIALELLNRKLNYDLVWIVNRGTSYIFPRGIRTVERGSFRELFELATARFWIDNTRKEEFIYKSEKQCYIQTWHGFVPLKKMEKDAIQTLSKDYISSAIHDGAMTDLMLSGCKIRTNLYNMSFWYDGEVKEWGSPRNDMFFKDFNYKEKVSDFFKIDSKYKTLLYAPTFRDDRSVTPYNIDFEKLIPTLQNKFGGEWRVLIRLHPNIADQCSFMKYSNTVINASSYDDIQELFAASDVLITDYSDCMFEFSLMRKPVFLYTPDLESYTKSRDFYRDFKSLPYPMADTNDNLRTLILDFDNKTYNDSLTIFFEEIGVLENGTASKSVVDYITSF